MKNKIIFLLLFLTSFNAVAKDFDDRLYVVPHASYIWSDDDRQTSRNDYGFGVGLGKALNEEFNLEVKTFFNSHEHNDLNSSKINYQWDNFGASVDLLYFLKRDQISHYLVGALGAMDSRVHGKNALGVIAEAGIGAAYDLNENFAIRSDIRYRFNSNFNNNLTNNNADEYNDLLVNVALVIPFGQKSGKIVNNVNNDLDFDGVINRKDKCPNTKRGVKVDKSGCDKVVNLVGVNFLPGSSKLTIQAKKILDKLAKDIISSKRKGKIEIQGHTSSDGSEKLNKILSQKRAQSVANYLQESGVKNKLTAIGYGEERLIFDESTSQGRLKNRRVELIWK